MNITIKGKLLGGFIIILLLLVSAAVFMVGEFSAGNERLSDIVNVSAERRSLSYQLQIAVLEVTRNEKNLILEDDPVKKNTYRDRIYETLEDIENKSARLKELSDEKGKSILNEFTVTLRDFKKDIDEIVSLAMKEEDEKAFQISGVQTREKREEMTRQLARLVDKNVKSMAADKLLSDNNYDTARNLIIGLIIASVLISIFISYWIIQGITKRISSIAAEAEKIASREFTGSKPEEATVDELRPIFNSLVSINDSFREVTASANSVASGNYTTDFVPRSDKDILGNALKKLTESLRESTAANERHNWLSTGKNQLNEKLAGDQSIEDLATNTITFLAGYLEADIGAVYLFSDKENTFVLSGRYAFTSPEDTKEKFAWNEGLIGQAAHESKQLLLTDITEEQLRITSSVLHAKPKNLLVTPFSFAGKILGVIEIGKLSRFTEVEKEFITSSMEVIGVAVNTAFTRKQIKQLYDETSEKNRLLTNQQLEIEQQLEGLNDVALVSITDINGNITYVNDRFVKVSKYSKQELAGKNHRLLKSGKQPDGLFTGMWKAISMGKVWNGEIMNKAKDGSYYWVDTTIIPITNVDGKIEKFLSVRFEISSLKEQQEKLKELNDETNEKNRLLTNQQLEIKQQLEGLNDVALVSITDVDGNITYVNDKFVNVSKYSKQELAGKNHRLLKSGKQPDGLFTGMWKAISMGRVWNGEIMNKAKDGSYYWVDTTIIPITNVDGKIEKFLSVRFEISNLKEQQEKLKDLNDELQSQQEELKQMNEELEEQAQNLKQQQEELQMTNEELEEQTQSLELKNKEVQAAKYDIEQKTKQLEISSKYKSEFLANMSHELRTPLNSLLILSKDLSDNKNKNLDKEQVESAEIIYKSGRDLLTLINEVLDLSKIEAGKMEISVERISVRNFINELLRDFKHHADQKGLKLDSKFADDLPEFIRTDSQRLSQVLKNLLSNAIKFTEKGNVEIHAGRHTESTLIFTVTDTGIGIEEEKQMAIFEAFQQADGGTSRKYGGTGLGLSISRELAKLLGGEIKLVSKLHTGSSFSLIIPMEVHAERKHSRPAAAKKPEQNLFTKPAEKNKEYLNYPTIADDRASITKEDKVVLVIEDDLKFAGILLKQANSKGFRCLAAATGEDGLALVEKYKPQAIILDLDLPGMSGQKVLAELKANPALRHIPVHIISVNERSLDTIKEGAVEYLTKPVNKKDMDDAFDRIESFVNRQMKNLLIVEDDQNSRKAIRKLIGNGDVQCFEAESGKDALSIYKENHIDCIVLDIGLPDMNGFELIYKLEKLESRHIPPIIIYTGKELTKEENEELQKYAESIIIKGVRSEERLLDETALFLHRTISNLPEQKRQIITGLYDKETILRAKKILLVDDDMRNVFALSKVLKERGMEIIKAENGKNALEMLDQHHDVDLVLMDIMMPEMDGYEAMRRIRLQEKFKNLPVIALTAKAMKDDKQKCIDAGANDYITKPVDIERLLSLMRVWLSKNM